MWCTTERCNMSHVREDRLRGAALLSSICAISELQQFHGVRRFELERSCCFSALLLDEERGRLFVGAKNFLLSLSLDNIAKQEHKVGQNHFNHDVKCRETIFFRWIIFLILMYKCFTPPQHKKKVCSAILSQSLLGSQCFDSPLDSYNHACVIKSYNHP